MSSDRKTPADVWKAKLLEELASQVPGVIFQFLLRPDGSSCYPYVNDAANELFELSPNVLSRSAEQVFQRIHPDDLERIEAGIRRSALTLDVWRDEGRIILPRKGLRWLEGHATPRRLEDGSVLWHGFMTDITERRKAGEALERSEERLALALKGANDALWDWDLESGALYYSPRWWGMLGYAVGELEPREELWREFMHPEDRERVNKALAGFLAKGPDNYAITFRLRHKQGHYVPVDSRGFIVRNNAGDPVRIAGTNIDLTEHVRAEQALRESEARFRELFEHSPVAYLALDHYGAVQDMNGPLLDLVDFDAEDLLGKPFQQLWSAATLERNAELFSKASHRRQMRAELELLRSDGEALTVVMDMRVQRDVSGSFVRFHCVLHDITERKQAEEELRIAAVAFESQQGMLVTDQCRTIIRVNRRFTELTGYLPEQAVGQPLSMFRTPSHEPAFYETMAETVRHQSRWEGELWVRSATGADFPAWAMATAVKSAEGWVSHYVLAFSDITERKKAEETIRKLAFQDPLTQLPNRRLLADRLDHGLKAALRSGTHGALLFVDLDYFKRLNDTWGHDVGDELLVQVAGRLTSCARKSDTVARLGGDEFIVMLGGLSPDREIAARCAERLAQQIGAALNQAYRMEHMPGGTYQGSASIGVSLYGDTGDTADSIIKRADIALYEAKAAGRNTMRFYGGDQLVGETRVPSSD
ncbi:MAG: PAS domain S-box protein [Ectothiorhodospiraceae bacterium]|nr:PAS domain S-box protein [Ectothiorhodospiraceae bacterium]